jgi:hypothetical protein
VRKKGETENRTDKTDREECRFVHTLHGHTPMLKWRPQFVLPHCLISYYLSFHITWSLKPTYTLSEFPSSSFKHPTQPTIESRPVSAMLLASRLKTESPKLEPRLEPRLLAGPPRLPSPNPCSKFIAIRALYR